MPTDKMVEGYERVLGLEPGTLIRVLEEARVESHGDPFAKRRSGIPVDSIPETAGDESGSQDTSRTRWFHRRWTITTAGVLIIGLVTLVVILLTGRPRSPAVEVPDGTDPRVTGCATGAVTSDSVDVYDPPEHLIGTLQLRSSARCGTSWGRFVPTSALSIKPTFTLEIDVDRPADGAAARYHVTYDGLPAYGNMLISSHECVYAQLTFKRLGQPSLPPVQTACRQAPGS